MQQLGTSGSVVLYTNLFFFCCFVLGFVLFFLPVSCFWDLYLPASPSCLNTRQIPTDRDDEALSHGIKSRGGIRMECVEERGCSAAL